MTGTPYLHLFDVDPDEPAPASPQRDRDDRATEPIGADVGVVVVGVSGHVEEIVLDQAQIRRLRPGPLGELVADAINRAESRARQQLPKGAHA